MSSFPHIHQLRGDELSNDMALKNYTTIVPADRSIQEIQSSLVKHGATGVLYEYEKDTGRISALKFKLEVKGSSIGFSLPVNWRLFQAVLKQDRIKRWDDEDYVYRVSWRNIRDWVLAKWRSMRRILWNFRRCSFRSLPERTAKRFTNWSATDFYSEMENSPKQSRVWTHRLTPGLVSVLVECIKYVHANSKNQFRLADLPLSHTGFCNAQKSRYWGLIHHVPEKRRFWLITNHGSAFLRGEIDMHHSATDRRVRACSLSKGTLENRTLPTRARL